MKEMLEFKPNEYEVYWRDTWEKENIYCVDNPINANKPKYYCLDMFPYPSGEGLHVGHWRGYVLSDVWVRYKLLKGYNVLHPMGWDNFGLPAENDAIKKGIHPKESTRKNINNMRRQLKEIGCAYDWSKEIDTTHPDYYKWTQFIFLKMYEMGLAYQKYQPVNWCNNCNVVLANEEVAGGLCERCSGSNIEKRQIKQWMLKITQYAEELLNDLDTLDWPYKVKEMQRNWIGKSEGAYVNFKIDDHINKYITVFTTRPDTLFGATFVVLAPENPIVSEIMSNECKDKVMNYISKVQLMSNIDRQVDKEKDGVFIGAYVINPVNGMKIPIYISSYVLMDYGTGAIMAVPAHDERDFEFAKKHKIPIVEVVFSDKSERDNNGALKAAYIGNGKIINSDYLNGLDVFTAKKTIIEKLYARGQGEKATNYKLRDWIFARQRYWGEPIPIIYCDKCGIVPVPYEQLPVLLPDVKSYKPSNNGTSPLASIYDWVNTTCTSCNGPAKRETDTMPQWAGSSWYYLRYPDKYNNNKIASKEMLDTWLPVHMYVGGIEHAVLHLLYARFWTKALYDAKLVSFKEPFTRLFNQGMVLRRAYRCKPCNRWVYDAELDLSVSDSNKVCPVCKNLLDISIEKMSKSKGNGISPDPLVKKYGTDALRMYELFTGDPALDCEWNDDGIKACYNFLKKSWDFIYSAKPISSSSERASKAINRLINNVEQRLLAFKFNTIISAMMEFINEALQIPSEFSEEDLQKFIIVISPIVPHFSEEIWHNRLKKNNHVFHNSFPEVDKEKLIDDVIEYVVQINGKNRMKIVLPNNIDKQSALLKLKDNTKFKELLNESLIKNEIFIDKKLINIVV